MTDITIPPAALEAAARAAAEDRGYDWEMHPSFHKAFRRMTHAAALALLENWEGMSQLAENDSASIREMAAIILPLTEKTDG